MQPATPTTPITVLEVPWDKLLDSVKKVVTRHPTQILLVPLPVQRRMTLVLVSPAQVSPTLIDLRQTI